MNFFVAVFIAVVLTLAYLTGYSFGLERGLEANMGTGDEVWDCAYSRITNFALCDLERKK